MWMDDVEMAIDAYRVWLGTKIDLAEDAVFMYAKEHPDEIPRERATYHARGLREALEAFNNIFKAGEEDVTKVLHS